MKKIILALLLFCLSVSASAEEKLPRVYGATFPSSFALYVFNPDLLVGWNGILREYEKKYIPEKYQKLPVLGGWYGKGMIPDKEVLLQGRIDKAFFLSGDRRESSEIIEALKKLRIPMIVMKGITLQDSIDMFRALGREFNMPERGEELASYAEHSLQKVAGMLKGLPDDKRVRVYMAQGVDGLTTSCDGSTRSKAIFLAGGVNVHKCSPEMRESVLQISFEQIMNYDPDVILINHPAFQERFRTDGRWKVLRAVREGRAYFVPYEPFSWLDRPASFMRFIGIQWLATRLHPDLCKIDMVAETRHFIKLFFHKEITSEQARLILKQ